MNNTITVALVDDHALLRKALANFLTNLDYQVLYECDNGKQFIEKITENNLPEIVLMDINMPQMDGFETTLWLKRNYPTVKVLALSMYDEEASIIRMIRNGARGYVLKDINPNELKQAIDSIITRGFHYSDLVSGRLIRSIQNEGDEKNNGKNISTLHEKYIEFLKLASTELTYKEIAAQMHLSPRTIDGYRDELFEKLNVRSRVGLVLFAIKNGIIHLE